MVLEIVVAFFQDDFACRGIGEVCEGMLGGCGDEGFSGLGFAWDVLGRGAFVILCDGLEAGLKFGDGDRAVSCDWYTGASFCVGFVCFGGDTFVAQFNAGGL